MKFAREYNEALKREDFPYDFPNEWVRSAISYGQLKKCIKKVSGELASLGLDPTTLKHLLDTVNAGESVEHGPQIDIRSEGFSSENNNASQPKLTLVIETEDGIPVNASLSEETKRHLSNLATGKGGKLEEARGSKSSLTGVIESSDSLHDSRRDPDPKSIPAETEDDRNGDKSTRQLSRSLGDRPSHIQSVEISLTSDSQFFVLLRKELTELESLQSKEEENMLKQVDTISRAVAKIASPSSKSELYRWREIFDLYLQAKVFFSDGEIEHGDRRAVAAAKQLTWFESQVQNAGDAEKSSKLKESRATLAQFMCLNRILLRNLQFQEINRTAMTKILKKFDKRTALSVQRRVPNMLSHEPLIIRRIAKAVCFKISDELVPIIPQLNDYLCPVCFSISYKPIRLECGHIFCIRCMIVMQRAKQDHCPLCRGTVVMKADSGNLDPSMINFLKKYFPAEVKTKQKENERAAAFDKFGEPGHDCTVM